MKKMPPFFAIAFFAIVGLLFSKVNAQSTPGTMTFNVTTTSTGNYSPKHVVAIWIEDANGIFVKTKLRQAVARKQWLATWITKSAENVVDATTGATLANHTAPITVSWNGTNVAGTLVPDGTYKVGIQMAWSNANGPVSYFTFTKGTTPFSSTPTATSNYTAMTLTWNPAVAVVASAAPTTICKGSTTQLTATP
ncbi:MAG: DUF2271 domain-containing protein [Bacteroidota bacterium]